MNLGIKMGYLHICILLLADDIVLVREHEQNLQRMLSSIEDECHFLCYCSGYKTERKQFLLDTKFNVSNLKLLSPNGLFIAFMTSESAFLLKFVECIWMKKNFSRKSIILLCLLTCVFLFVLVYIMFCKMFHHHNILFYW